MPEHLRAACITSEPLNASQNRGKKSKNTRMLQVELIYSKYRTQRLSVPYKPKKHQAYHENQEPAFAG